MIAAGTALASQRTRGLLTLSRHRRLCLPCGSSTAAPAVPQRVSRKFLVYVCTTTPVVALLCIVVLRQKQLPSPLTY